MKMVFPGQAPSTILHTKNYLSLTKCKGWNIILSTESNVVRILLSTFQAWIISLAQQRGSNPLVNLSKLGSFRSLSNVVRILLSTFRSLDHFATWFESSCQPFEAWIISLAQQRGSNPLVNLSKLGSFRSLSNVVRILLSTFRSLDHFARSATWFESSCQPFEAWIISLAQQRLILFSCAN